MRKKLTCLLLVLVMLLGMLPVSANALTESSLTKAFDAEFGKTYSHSWTYATRNNNPLAKVVLTENGILTINLARPYNAEDYDYEEVIFKVYSSKDISSYAVSIDSDYSKDLDDENCVMQLCLEKGTYYIEADLDASIYSGDPGYTTSYSFSFEGCSYVEAEKNNSKSVATPMVLGEMYYGTYGRGDNEDWYSFEVSTGKYVITFDHFVELDDTTAIMKIQLPGGTEVSPMYSAADYIDENGRNYYIFSVPQDGTAFVRIYNYSNAPVLYGIRFDNAADYHKHNYIASVTLPTCSKDGYTVYTCACGEKYTDDLMPANGLHIYDNEYDATCNRCGQKTRTVPASNAFIETYDVGDTASTAQFITLSSVGASIAYDDIDWYRFEIKEKSKVTLFASCDWQAMHFDIYNADRSLVWRGSDLGWGSESYRDRIYTTLDAGTYYVRVYNGSKLYQSLVYAFNIDAEAIHEHSYTANTVYPATCQKQGYTVYTCNCGDSYTDNFTTERGDHSWDNANCTVTRTCKICGATKAATEHVFAHQYDYKCDNCDETRVVDMTRPMVDMYRMYNPNTGEHFYTGSTVERDNLISVGWQYEGIGFTFPLTTGAPVHRLFQSSTGEHLYTMDEDEKAKLMDEGWNYEGIAFNSGFENEVPQFRLHNPNASVGAYHFTASTVERDTLIAAGWEYQGIGWYSLGGN